ncbi:MAG TPA: DUF998 domain-containing protein [Acidimicrobiales bacterium]|jgi:hypothetical protein|nr:DUF998 domain-containing protein [Acidimicrobiales bacterium]
MTTARVDVARALGIGGVAAYNWWVVVPFVPGLMTSHNEFFSDLEVPGLRDADLMQRADLVAGIVLVVALLMRSASGRNGARREWKWLLAFAAAGAIGGRFPYVCSEGLSATCRNLEWHMELPLHHYIHVVSGIAEFLFLTVAVVVAVRRTQGETTWEARAFRAILKVLIVGYPLLGFVYLSDRLGAFVEPIFFVSFSAMIIVSLFEPVGRVTAPAELDGDAAIEEVAEWDGVRTTGNA